MAQTAPYGSWRSPITTDLLVQSVVGLSQPQLRDDQLLWCESRPGEAGRVVPVRRLPGGGAEDLVPPAYSARTLVHEYGGACTLTDGSTLWFSNFSDQRIWRVPLAAGAERTPTPATAETDRPAGARYADFQLLPGRPWLVAVRERHGEDVLNDIVLVPAGGQDEVRPLAGGHDFFSAPRPSPDGSMLAWLSWDHPNMPWDGTILRVGRLGPDLSLEDVRIVAGGPEESISQPRWSPAGVLHYLSDRSGWWNLYADDAGRDQAVLGMEAEMGGPDWAFGQSTYAFLADGRACVAWSDRDGGHLGVLEEGRLRELARQYSSFTGLAAEGARLVTVAGSPTESPALVILDADDGSIEVVRTSRPAPVDPAYISVPRALDYPTEGGRAHALFYEPKNPEYSGPEDERPPLVVMSHGGPTGQASSVLNPVIQYFTSRGMAVVDVDYGGSSGYGREYRRRLNGLWGVVDVDDCVNAARWLAARGEVDPARLAIRGGSAGGYTTLSALTFRDAFAVGASHYGVADAAALARDTHKFESRYLDRLIGPWPEAQDLYAERSPICHTDQLSCPVILFQGLEDRIVPPNQAETMAAALRAKGIPFALLTFEGEQHGFRHAETIKTVIAAELAFYGRVLGFSPADPAPGLAIENESALTPAGPAESK